MEKTLALIPLIEIDKAKSELIKKAKKLKIEDSTIITTHPLRHTILVTTSSLEFLEYIFTSKYFTIKTLPSRKRGT